MIWIIVVGLVAGFIARLLAPGPNNPTGFILTCVLGIAGSFLATFVGQAVGWYGPGQGAGFIAATVGALEDCNMKTLDLVVSPEYGPLVATCAAYGIRRSAAFALVRDGLVRNFTLGRKRYVFIEDLRSLPGRLAVQASRGKS